MWHLPRLFRGVWNSQNIPPSFKISLFPLSFTHCLVTHISASDSFSTMALYKSIYLLTYTDWPPVCLLLAFRWLCVRGVLHICAVHLLNYLLTGSRWASDNIDSLVISNSYISVSFDRKYAEWPLMFLGLNRAFTWWRFPGVRSICTEKPEVEMKLAEAWHIGTQINQD